MILIGLGANLPTRQFGPPRATLGAALARMQADGLAITKRSPWYESAPVPVSDQPWYVNGVCEIATSMTADQVVDYLLALESRFGRRRGALNAARVLDLDLIAYHQEVRTGNDRSELTVPHPRMSGRAFVILPLMDIAPAWRHPLSGKAIAELASELAQEQETKAMADADGLFGTEWKGGVPD